MSLRERFGPGERAYVVAAVLAAGVLCTLAFCGSAHAQWAGATAGWVRADQTGGSGGGTTLPADAAGVLLNDGAGSLSWGPWTWSVDDEEWTVANDGGIALTNGVTTTHFRGDGMVAGSSHWQNTGTAQSSWQQEGATGSHVTIQQVAGDSPSITVTAADTSAAEALPTLVGVGPIILVKTQADSPVTLTLAQSGARLANTGTTAQVEWLLPPAASGAHFVACSIDSDGMKLTADAGDTITYGADTSGAAGNITATSGCATFTAFDTTRWLVESATSTWTVSAP